MSLRIKLRALGTEEQDAEIFKNITFGRTRPSPTDTRDYVACASTESKIYPQEYIAPDTEILNQENIGSCVAHSCATAIAQGEEVLVSGHNEYSRGYIYGNRGEDDYLGEGMVMREALKQLNHCGDTLYKDFPYNKTYKEVRELINKDRDELAKKASEHIILEYFRCYTESQIKDTIMEKGGVLICVPVYSDFSRNLSRTKTCKLQGYHAMIIVGWTKDNRWIVQNSWGKMWGYQGKLYMDADYPVDEYWGITVTSGDIVPKKKTWIDKVCDFLTYIISCIVSIFKK